MQVHGTKQGPRQHHLRCVLEAVLQVGQKSQFYSKIFKMQASIHMKVLAPTTQYVRAMAPYR
jgi:hypothetical protein